MLRSLTQSLSHSLNGMNLSRVQCRPIHVTSVQYGIKDFFDPVLAPGETFVTGRGWTVSDLRRKSYSDLHKLWFVLYKERNVLLTHKEKVRRAQRPYLPEEEARYTKVKRSMAGIKFVINERKNIEMKLNPPPADHNKTPGRRTAVFSVDSKE